MGVDIDNQLKYDAFISYRHCDLDQFVATNLHKKLESFKIPKAVQKLVKTDKTKIERVFRDEDELPLSEDLSEPIDIALSNSEFLIVICTPRLSQSRWCLREIETFIKTHDRKHVLLVLAEGEPDESFPEIMTYEDVEETDKDGNVNIVRKTIEPLAADVRGLNKRETLNAMDIAVIKLAAAMFDLNYDDLKQRHREQRLKKMFALWGTVTAAVMVFAIVCLGLFVVILKQRNDIKDRYASTVAYAAEGLLDDGRRQAAIYILRSVLDDKEAYNADAYRQMINALDLYAVGEEYIPLKYFSIPSMVTDYKLSGNNKYIALAGVNGSCQIIETNENKIIYSFETVQYDLSSYDYGFDGETGFIYTKDDSVIYVDFAEISEKILYESGATIISDANCDVTGIFMADKYVGLQNGEVVYETNLGSVGHGDNEFEYLSYVYSPDGNHVLLSVLYSDDSYLLQINTATGDVELVYQMDVNEILTYATDGRKIYYTQGNYPEDRPPVDSTMYIIDTNKPDDIKSVIIPLLATRDIVLCDTGICIISDKSAIMLDKNNYSITDKIEGINEINSAFTYKSGVGIVDLDGSFWVFSDEFVNGSDMTSELFGIAPKSTTSQVIFQNDKFYYCFGDNYVVEYVDNERAVKETEEFKEFGYYDELWLGEEAGEELKNINDIDSVYVYSSVYSNDKKHIAVMMCDKTLRIYDANTYKLEKVEYGIKNIVNAVLISFVYVEEADIYILNAGLCSYIFDADFNYIADTDYCVGFEDGSFIVICQEEYYKLTMFSYKEVLKLADEELNGYIPDEAIMDKYIDK